MLHLRCCVFSLAVVAGITTPGLSQTDPAVELREAQKLIESGDVTAAIPLLEKTVTTAPKNFDARLALGRALDLQGRHAQARKHMEEALRISTDEQRNSALTALGVSYAFESKADEAARYYQRAFDAQVQADERATASGLANALARVYLESGNLKKAEEWYTTGFEMSKKIPGISADQAALWEMRHHHGLARIAARRNDRAAAGRHAEAVRAALDRGVAESQRVNYPYLLGYIAFFQKDYKRAAEELLKGDQNDPFVLGLIAQSYERMGQRDEAASYYRKVMASGAHNINAAFSRPRARAFLR